MKELEAWGTPAFLIVPNAGHRMDARIWKKRYPALTVIAPPAARAKVEPIVAVDRTDGDLGDPGVTLTFPACAAGREALMTVKHADGRTTIIINDLVMNSRHGRGFSGFMFKLLGFTSNGPQVSLPSRLAARQGQAGLEDAAPAARRHAEAVPRHRVARPHAGDGRRRRAARRLQYVLTASVPSLC